MVKSVVVIFLMSLALVVLWFGSGGIRGGAESGLLFHNLGRAAEMTGSSWTDTGLGTVVGAGTAGNPLFHALGNLQNAGISATAVQAMVYFVILLVSGLSVFFLTKTFFPKIADKFALLAALFYWFNPFTLVNILGRNLDNYKLFFVAFPLLWLIYVFGLKHRRFHYAFLLAVVSGIFSYSFTFVPSILVLWGTLFVTALFYWLYSEHKGRRTFYPAYFLTSIFGFLLVNFWWLSQVFGFVSSSAYEVAASDFFDDKGNLATLTALSERLGYFVNNLRFLHGPYYYEGPSWSWARFYVSAPAVVIEFLVAVVILGAIVKFRRNKGVLLLGFLFTASLFLMKGNSEPFGELFQAAFQSFTFLQVLRNPFEKIGFLLVMVGSILLGFGLWQFSKVKRKIAKYTFFVSFLILSVFYGFPFWSGLVFTTTEGNVLRSNLIKVPEYYTEASSWIDSQPGTFRFISMPLGGEAVTYKWERDYLGVELSGLLFQTPNVSFNSTIPLYNDIVSSLSTYQIEPEVLSFFPFINAKYIVWRDDIDYMAREMPDPKTTRAKLDKWEEAGLVTLRFETGKLAVYEINKNYNWPKIYLAQKKYIANTSDLAFLAAFFDDFPAEKVAIFGDECLEKCRSFERLVYVPEKVYFQKVASPLPRELSDTELMAKLFYSKHLPGDLLYPFIRLNERILEAREKDYDGWLLYKTGILGKRATEIYRLRKSGVEGKLLEKAEAGYMSALNELEKDIEMLTKFTSPVSSVVKNSLIYQWVLLERVGFESQKDSLSSLLSQWNVKPTFELPVSEDSYIIASFLLPISGQYSIVGLDSAADVYLDGKKLDDTVENITIEPGEHEVAVQAEGENVYGDVINTTGETLMLSNLNDSYWEFELSDHPTEYDLEFDYRFTKGNSFQVKILQDIENDDNSFHQPLVKDELFHDWAHFEARFTTLAGAEKANLFFKPVRENYCEKLWWGWPTCVERDAQFSIEVRNLRLREVNSPQLALVLEESKSPEAISEVTFEKLSPTKYKASINKPDNFDEILVFSELFNDNWQASYAGGELIPQDAHLLTNVYANGWLIDRSGEYDVLIEFKSENALQTGRLISLLAAAVGLALFVILIFKNYKNA